MPIANNGPMLSLFLRFIAVIWLMTIFENVEQLIFREKNVHNFLTLCNLISPHVEPNYLVVEINCRNSKAV